MQAVREAVAAGEWERVRLLLHPYLHWTFADGTTVRGRTNVLARLRAAGEVAPAREVELRDGQVYRWS